MEAIAISALRILLLATLFLGLLVEIKTGGLGAGTMLAIVAAGVFFGSQYVEGLVSFYQIGMFLAGLLMIIVEMLMPTVGLLAGVGIAAMLYSIVLALGGEVDAVYALLASVVIALIIFALLVKRLPSSKLWQKFVLHDSATANKGYVSAATRSELIGCTGVAETDLRPAGRALLSGEPTDVVSDGAFIARGAQVIVVATEGSRIVVRAVS